MLSKQIHIGSKIFVQLDWISTLKLRGQQIPQIEPSLFFKIEPKKF